MRAYGSIISHFRIGLLLVASTATISSIAQAAPASPAVTSGSAVVVPMHRVASQAVDRNAGNAAIEAAVETSTNLARSANNAVPLQHNETLRRIAEAYAKQMAVGGFFSHTDPQGKVISDRALDAGYNYSAIGENLSRLQVQDTQNIVTYTMNGWMSSPMHRANIVDPDFTDIGIGVYRAADGQFYFCQLLGHQQ